MRTTLRLATAYSHTRWSQWGECCRYQDAADDEETTRVSSCPSASPNSSTRVQTARSVLPRVRPATNGASPGRVQRSADYAALVFALDVHRRIPSVDHNRRLLLDRILCARIPDEVVEGNCIHAYPTGSVDGMFSYPRLARLRKRYFNSPRRERGVVTVGELEHAFLAERLKSRAEGQTVGGEVISNDLGTGETVHDVGDSRRAVERN